MLLFGADSKTPGKRWEAHGIDLQRGEPLIVDPAGNIAGTELQTG
ncbi:hypothetical protein [Bradyrhizobium sp. AZCC 2289]